MKINFKKHLENNKSLLARIVSHGLVDILKDKKELIITEEYEKDKILDIVLTVNGIEIDVEEFCNSWQDQIDERTSKIVQEYVKEKYENAFNNIDELLFDLKNRLNDEIEKRVEDWEKGEQT